MVLSAELRRAFGLARKVKELRVQGGDLHFELLFERCCTIGRQPAPRLAVHKIGGGGRISERAGRLGERQQSDPEIRDVLVQNI